MRRLLVIASLLFVAACRQPAAPCTSSRDCLSSELCHQGLCRKTCNAGGDCFSDETCRDGICMPQTTAGDAASDAAVDAGAGDAALADTGRTDRGHDAAAPDTGYHDSAGPELQQADAHGTDAAGGDVATHDAAATDHGPTDQPGIDTASDAGWESGRDDVAATDQGGLDAPGGDAAAADDASTDGSTGCNNWALHFDGASDFVARDDDPRFDGLPQITVEAWVNFSSIGSHHDIDYVVVHENVASYTGYSLRLRLGGLYFRINDGTSMHTVSGGTPTTGVWHHIAGSYDGSNLRIFVDGVLKGTAAAVAVTIADSAEPLSIGGDSAGGASIDGMIDEVRISDIARYTAAFAPPTAPFAVDGNTRALFHLDEGSGQLTADQGATAQARLGATTAVESTDPAWVGAPCIKDMRP
jgi:hypothetical protein